MRELDRLPKTSNRAKRRPGRAAGWLPCSWPSRPGRGELLQAQETHGVASVFASPSLKFGSCRLTTIGTQVGSSERSVEPSLVIQDRLGAMTVRASPRTNRAFLDRVHRTCVDVARRRRTASRSCDFFFDRRLDDGFGRFGRSRVDTVSSASPHGHDDALLRTRCRRMIVVLQLARHRRDISFGGDSSGPSRCCLGPRGSRLHGQR
jgi:hypothetical protein